MSARLEPPLAAEAMSRTGTGGAVRGRFHADGRRAMSCFGVFSSAAPTGACAATPAVTNGRTDEQIAAPHATPEGTVAFLRRVLANKTTLPDSFGLIIKEFLQRIEHLQKPMAKFNSRFEHEYHELCASIYCEPWYEDAITPQTKHTLAKNRYRDVLPFEQTRVKLANPLNKPAGDYINANFIDDAYIACCAPVRTAIRDFWHMVWQVDVCVVLMLTNFVERERIKADMYWDSRRQPVDFDGVITQLVSEEAHTAHAGFIVRKFNVWTPTTKVTPRVVLHVQLTTWPDHGVLRDFRVIAPMLELVNSYRECEAASRPGRTQRVVVHCSAGIGRSGTFIAIDLILKALQDAFAAASEGRTAEGEVLLRQALDVRSLVHRMRTQRPGMVQTPEQYEMIYRYVAAVLTNAQPW